MIAARVSDPSSEIPVPIPVLLAIGREEIRPTGPHVAGHVLHGDRDAVRFRVDGEEKLLVRQLSERFSAVSLYLRYWSKASSRNGSPRTFMALQDSYSLALRIVLMDSMTVWKSEFCAAFSMAFGCSIVWTIAATG